MMEKPLGIRCYGHISHLPGSLAGDGDRYCEPDRAAICCERTRDDRDRIYVTEKLDGSNVAVALHCGEILALNRAGYIAHTSGFEQHAKFTRWVADNKNRFLALLEEGERCAGEWLAQAHGVRYSLRHEPFVIFDIMTGKDRRSWPASLRRIVNAGFVPPFCLNPDHAPLSIDDAMGRLTESPHGGDIPEGAVWRVERDGVFDFMAKYVKPGKVNGCLLPEVSGREAVWNWTQNGEIPCATL